MASLRCVGSPGGCTRPVQVVRHQRLNKLQPCRAPKLATWVARCSNQSEEESAPEEPAEPKVCPTCGVAITEVPGGCDMEGRVVGGVGAIAGFDWWPIKAYRPCPALEAAGVAYTRKGQLTNEVLFGKATKNKL